MSSKNSALASLTATYTDSENEDHNISDDAESTHSDSQESPIRLQSISTIEQTDNKDNLEYKKTPPKRNKALRLVSYIDDTIEDDVSPQREQIPKIDKNILDDEEPIKIKTPPKKVDKIVSYGFNLPPEPKGKCSQELQEKITSLYEKMKNSSMDPNKIIQERKEFRNPSIYEKLIQYCDINELGTNYPPEIYDPTSWGKESFYEELAKAQKTEMDKLEKARKENAKADINNGSKKAEDDMKKRKSKWDQPSLTVSSTSSSVQQPLTTTISGTKGTVISALGPLAKKAKN